MPWTGSVMKPRRRARDAAPVAAFWDTSGLVPLCCYQSYTAAARKATRTYRRQVTWWTTPVEIVSSFNRLHRERTLTAEELGQALQRLNLLRGRWNEIQPSDEVRDTAQRLLGVHKLRAADALQLAAALVWCSHRPRGRHFIGADGALALAAETEGFTVVRLL